MARAFTVGLVLLAGCGDNETPGDPLEIRPLTDLNPDPSIVEVNLVAAPEQVEYVPGKRADIWGYRDGAIPGSRPTVPGPLLEAVEVPRALLQSPSRLLERTALVFGGRTDLVTTDLVERVVREPLDVEAVEDDLSLGRALGDGLDVRGGHVDGDGFELGAPNRAKLVEESSQRVDVLTGLRPYDARAVVVNDHCDVLVVAPVRQLVDADRREPLEWVALLVGATTRWMMVPTVSQAMRIIELTAVLSHRCAR